MNKTAQCAGLETSASAKGIVIPPPGCSESSSVRNMALASINSLLNHQQQALSIDQRVRFKATVSFCHRPMFRFSFLMA